MSTTNDRIAAFGREVRRRREALGLTAEQLAEQVELTPKELETIETNEGEPSLATVYALARALGCAPGALFEDASEASGSVPEAARLVAQLSRKQQKAFLAFLETIIET